MLQKLSHVKIIDNTGVISAIVIQVFNGTKVYARLGNIIRISTKTIKKLRKTKKVAANRRHRVIARKKRKMATIIRVRWPLNYIDGATLHFHDNAVILYKKPKMLKGKRFYGITSRVLGYEKLLNRFIFYI